MQAVKERKERSVSAKSFAFWVMAHERSKLTETERLLEIREGFSTAWVDSIRQTFTSTADVILIYANASPSTFERRKKGKLPLDQVASERLDRLASVALLAEEVFEDKTAATVWLCEPNQALAGRSPLSLCDTEIGANQVRRILHALEWGGAA